VPEQYFSDPAALLALLDQNLQQFVLTQQTFGDEQLAEKEGCLRVRNTACSLCTFHPTGFHSAIEYF
jgi:hypothetical protein